MRKLMFVLCLSLSFTVSADNKGGPGGSMTPEQKLAQKKTQLNEMLDKRIASLQQAKSCVQRASTEQALQGCQPK